MDLVFLRGRGTPNGPNGGSLLTYWLSRFVLPSGLEDAINSYILPMAIRLATGEKLALGPIYPWSLYVRLDYCTHNILSLYFHVRLCYTY